MKSVDFVELTRITYQNNSFSFFPIGFSGLMNLIDYTVQSTKILKDSRRRPRHETSSLFLLQEEQRTEIYYIKIHILNPFPNKPLFLRVCSTSILKTLWKTEKLLVSSNFSFSHSVFYLLIEFSVIFIKFEIVVCKSFQFGRILNLSFGNGLMHTSGLFHQRA